MKIKEEIERTLKGFLLPVSFMELMSFDSVEDEFYSEGFELAVDSEKLGLKTYSCEKEFLNSICEFAIADGSGSTYGFWLNNKHNDLRLSPIIVFGSEGGCHVVAQSFDELLEILAFDSEPMIDWDGVCYVADSDNRRSPKNQKYKEWLKATLDLRDKEPREPNEIVEQAQSKYEVEFRIWLARFFKV